MREIDTVKIEQAVCDLLVKANLRISPDALSVLKTARENETGCAKFALDTIIKNNEIANTENIPVCQDTGLACVFIELGQEAVLKGKLLSDAVNDGVRASYLGHHFRAGATDPLSRENTKDNTPAIIHTEIVGGDKVKITVLPKGFGSENMSKLYMLSPTADTETVIRTIVDTVKDASNKPCPPIVVGVGIGGTFDYCALLSKKALLRPIGTLSERDDVKYIETESLRRINELNIGVQGFGGKNTALAVNVLTYPTHIAGLPLAVNIQCHAVRRESVIL